MILLGCDGDWWWYHSQYWLLQLSWFGCLQLDLQLFLFFDMFYDVVAVYINASKITLLGDLDVSY